ncbi:ABC transporter permease [Ruania albidiflava]|uniref:ABC transporter permease n=1 Tax=Ruania albidiflava TaxID=366586 RepID=UPI0003B76E03|nr:ABC transporter permease subunit [Ruania albidiflava]
MSTTEIDVTSPVEAAHQPTTDHGETTAPRSFAVVGGRARTRWLARAGVLAVVVGLWWLSTQVVFASNEVVSRMGPWAAATELVEQLGQPETWQAISVSLGRLLAGLALALVVGAPLGLLLGSSRLAEHATAPVVQLARMTSPLAWAPLVIVLLGSGGSAVVTLVALAATWPIVLGTSAGRRSIDQGALEVARTLGATWAERVRTVIAPGVAVHLRTSVRVALGISWVVLVPAEMFGVTNGLGYAVLNARDNIDYEALAATMLLIGIVGYLLDVLARYGARER